MMAISTAHFNQILTNHGETVTQISASARTYDDDYGSISTETTSETSITAYIEPIEDTEPLVMQGKIKSGSKRAFIKPSDDISNGDLIQDSDEVKWKVMDKIRNSSSGTAIYDEFIMVRNS